MWMIFVFSVLISLELDKQNCQAVQKKISILQRSGKNVQNVFFQVKKQGVSLWHDPSEFT